MNQVVIIPNQISLNKLSEFIRAYVIAAVLKSYRNVEVHKVMNIIYEKIICIRNLRSESLKKLILQPHEVKIISEVYSMTIPYLTTDVVDFINWIIQQGNE